MTLPIPELLFRVLDRLARELDDFRVRRLQRNLASCGERVRLSPLCHILNPEELCLGDDVQINAFTQVFAGGGVEVGDGALISSNCVITSVTHVKACGERHRAGAEPGTLRPVRIGRNAWIGAGAILLPGVTVGDHAVVGAGAVVTRDVPERCVHVGNPARFVERLEF